MRDCWIYYYFIILASDLCKLFSICCFSYTLGRSLCTVKQSIIASLSCQTLAPHKYNWKPLELTEEIRSETWHNKKCVQIVFHRIQHSTKIFGQHWGQIPAISAVKWFGLEEINEFHSRQSSHWKSGTTFNGAKNNCTWADIRKHFSSTAVDVTVVLHY